MTFRPFLRRRGVAPIAAAVLAGGSLIFTPTVAFAEAQEVPTKRPIYDEPLIEETPKKPDLVSSLASKFSLSSKPEEAPSPAPTPTDRLAVQIKRTRLFLHGHVTNAEEGLNNLMTSFLHLEDSFTSTVASLAPSKESGEQLMPGAIYVLVAAMAGSMVSRNRNIVFRATMPLAVGIGAGWLIIPVTMRNVGDLLWKYEQKAPVIAETHLRIRTATARAWHMTKMHSELAVNKVDETVQTGRQAVEDWVKQGK